MPIDHISGSSQGQKRLWVVSELYFPEETSTGYYMTRIAENLAGEYSVKVLCGQPNYSSRGKRALKYELRNGVEIFRAAGTTLNKNVILFRLLNMLTLGLSILVGALRRFRAGDSVLVVTTPPSLPFVVAIASLVKGANYTLLIHDNYPEILFAVGKSGEGSLLAKIMHFLNRWLYKHCTRIIACGRDMRTLLEHKNAGLDTRIDVIQNWAELETVRPRPRSENALLRELGLYDRFVLLYAGNMGHPNDLETIVEAAKVLKRRPEIHFIFLGSGVKQGWLEKCVADSKLDNVTLLAPRPRSEQIDFLNACDVALISLVKKMRGVSVPSRMYNILATGKPTIALVEDGSEIAMVLDEEDTGWHIEPGDVEGLVKTIENIYEKRSELGPFGERARKAALEKYSLEKAIERYRAALAG
jgi:glycosyltransferase involved in cell wall biosynthesis